MQIKTHTNTPIQTTSIQTNRTNKQKRKRKQRKQNRCKQTPSNNHYDKHKHKCKSKKTMQTNTKTLRHQTCKNQLKEQKERKREIEDAIVTRHTNDSLRAFSSSLRERLVFPANTSNSVASCEFLEDTRSAGQFGREDMHLFPFLFDCDLIVTESQGRDQRMRHTNSTLRFCDPPGHLLIPDRHSSMQVTTQLFQPGVRNRRGCTPVGKEFWKGRENGEKSTAAVRKHFEGYCWQQGKKKVGE